MKMPTATLLLREQSTVNLNHLVEKAVDRQPPLPFYNLDLKSAHLHLTLIPSKSDDEGFESDIDSLSIVSNESESKTNETDSANGSSSSDDSDDTEHASSSSSSSTSTSTSTTTPAENIVEIYNLVDCSCYTDSKFTDLLIFVIKNEALLFKFDNLENLRNFYINFTALKAVANQKIYNKLQAKFNLLHRTDNNGVTHIEITRERPSPPPLPAPLSNIKNNKIFKYPSTENILESKQIDFIKIWNSAEDLITPHQTQPRRPPIRRKVKPKAPAPPPPLPMKQQQQQQPTSTILPPPNTMSGQFVRVNVKLDFNHRMIVKSSTPPHHQYNKEPHPKKIGISQSSSLWTNSVPRLLLKHRNKCPPDNRQNINFTPMAYRYIDTTTTMPRLPSHHYQHKNYQTSMANRLFGLSPKLREFSRSNGDNCGSGANSAWTSSTEGNLKSVIKKQEKKKVKNDKKVTFSAYTTVQVV